MWTKEKIKLMISLWDTVNSKDMSEKIGETREEINFMASIIRKSGYPIQKKREIGYRELLIDKAMSEEGIEKIK